MHLNQYRQANRLTGNGVEPTNPPGEKPEIPQKPNELPGIEPPEQPMEDPIDLPEKPQEWPVESVY